MVINFTERGTHFDA